MLAYAASRPVVARRRSSPNTMLGIIGAHVALVALVMSARMELPRTLIDKPTTVDFIQPTKAPPPNPVRSRVQQQSRSIDDTPPLVPTLPPPQTFDPFPTIPNPGATGTTPTPTPTPLSLPTPRPVATGPELITPASDLRPPYPASKLAAEEEATLKLRLTIDEHGRVVAVDPVGRVDATFFEAARRYLIAHWRYQPAMRDGQAIASSTVITLKFQLDG